MVMRKRYKTKLFKIIGMVALSFVLVVMGLFPTKMVSAKVIGNDKTGIPDKNLYQAILFELGKKSDQKITEDDLEEVYSIGGYFIEKNRNKKVENLKGIGNLTKLTGLYVSNNCLSSVSGLEKLTQLWDLDVSNNKLTKLPSLKKLKKLVIEHTSFSGNRISEKEFKKKLPSKASNR